MEIITFDSSGGFPPASINNVFQLVTSDNLDDTTLPPEPLPITMKSNSNLSEYHDKLIQ